MKRFLVLGFLLAVVGVAAFASDVGEPAVATQGDVFAGVAGAELTDSEAELVEGDGFFGALAGAVIGAVTWAYGQAAKGIMDGGLSSDGAVSDICSAMLVGAVMGFVSNPL